MLKLSFTAFFCTLLTLVMAGSINAEPVVPLKQLVEKVVSSNPEVQTKHHNYLGAGFEQGIAKGGYLPKSRYYL